jgi:hypothetical protein
VGGVTGVFVCVCVYPIIPMCVSDQDPRSVDPSSVGDCVI